jgi:hypothetical protein
MFDQVPILRLLNLQLQRQRCSRLERFFKAGENIFVFETYYWPTRGIVNFPSAGILTVDHRIGSWLPLKSHPYLVAPPLVSVAWLSPSAPQVSRARRHGEPLAQLDAAAAVAAAGVAAVSAGVDLMNQFRPLFTNKI